MTIHGRRSGSRRSWLVIAGLIAFVVVGLATSTFGLQP